MIARAIQFIFVLLLLIGSAGTIRAGEPRLKKILPHLIDSKGRNSLYPSLYERDAYQFFLRTHPEQQAGLRFDVLWRGAHKNDPLRLRVEIRGMKNEIVRHETLETELKKKGWFGQWSSITLRDDAYKDFGEMTAWRVTLWDADQQVSEQKSFLW
ncbi:MAG: hypothetical protein ABI042_05080 [Verrucomicrobiota bacterium]